MNIAMIDINNTIPVEKYCAFLLYDESRLLCIFLKDNGRTTVSLPSPKQSQSEALQLTL